MLLPWQCFSRSTIIYDNLIVVLARKHIFPLFTSPRSKRQKVEKAFYSFVCFWRKLFSFVLSSGASFQSDKIFRCPSPRKKRRWATFNEMQLQRLNSAPERAFCVFSLLIRNVEMKLTSSCFLIIFHFPTRDSRQQRKFDLNTSGVEILKAERQQKRANERTDWTINFMILPDEHSNNSPRHIPELSYIWMNNKVCFYILLPILQRLSFSLSLRVENL